MPDLTEKEQKVVDALKVWAESWNVLFAALTEGESARNAVVPKGSHWYLVLVFNMNAPLKPIFDAAGPALQTALIGIVTALIAKYVKLPSA